MDKDPKHASKSTIFDLKRRRLKVWSWLSQSPDLNFIENMWIDLQRAVHAGQTRNLSVLEDFCTEEWEKSVKLELKQSRLLGVNDHKLLPWAYPFLLF